MDSHVITTSSPLRNDLLLSIANSGALDEISNYDGAVRHYIYHHGRLPRRDYTDSAVRKPLLFFIYQTGRQGPQNGFRLCLVQQGFRITSPTRVLDDVEDEIDRMEGEIPQDHMEVVVLG